jgi:hypothetical protein
VQYTYAMRDEIIAHIQRLATANGQAPGQKLFERETSIPAHAWIGKLWARWGDALIEAGYQPNAWQGRLDSDEVLNGIIEGIRYFGRFPSRHELMMYRQTNPAVPSDNAIKRHFGRRDDLIAALAKRAADDPAYDDIAPLLPAVAPKAATPRIATKPVDGYVYLIKSGNFYKVGRSNDAERRFKQISIALPDKAELFHMITTDDPPGIEAYWHRRFADRRANGEWFKLTAADVAAFKRRKFQ